MRVPLRASERDRQGAIAVLRTGYLDGRLSTDTFEARVAAAQSARSLATLRPLLADLRGRWLALPALLDLGRRVPRAQPVQATLLLSGCRRAELTVGRSNSCAVVFGGAAVSRHHARFECVGGQWYVHDLASTNGTFVDGVRVQRAPVGRDTQVRVGDAFLVIA